MISGLLEKLGTYNKDFDRKKIQRVLDLIEKNRAVYEKGVSYSLNLLEIILPLRPDEETIIAVLLRKLHVDKLITEKTIEKLFGRGVLGLLMGVKKLENLNYAENDRAVQVGVLKKMFLAMAKDIRVVLIVLSCRLYKMRHLGEIMSEEEGEAFAKETLNLYVPIAGRLGMYCMKSELDDLAFKYSNPKEYKKVTEQLERLRNGCRFSIDFVKGKLDEFLKARGIEAEVSGRIKNVYSIYRKLNRKGLDSIEDLFDVFAMRVILPVKTENGGGEVLDHLYGVLGLIHSEWRPISKRFKDYLAVPKANGYRSLHTVVLGLAPEDRNQPVEIQICDSEMYRDAEYGVASHWLYKEVASNKVQELKSQIAWLRGLEEIRGDFDLGSDGFKEIDVDIFKDRIFVLTPRGEVKDLPVGATPLDFAYLVHTDVGSKCVMAKVNGNVVSLDYELRNGDVVEIITKRDATPKLQWLSVVKTNVARNKIKAWFSALNKDNNIKGGRRLLNNQLARIGKPLLDQKYSTLKDYYGRNLSLSQRESLVEEVGSGAKLPNDVIRKVFPYEETVVSKTPRKKVFVESGKGSIERRVLIGGESGLPIKVAACCQPKIGDDITGYVTRGNRISIHKSSCLLLKSLNSERLVSSDWKGAVSEESNYLVRIKVRAIPRVGLMCDITSVISKVGVNIRDVSMKKLEKGLSEEYFLLELDSLDQFDLILDKLENVKGVLKVVKHEESGSK